MLNALRYIIRKIYHLYNLLENHLANFYLQDYSIYIQQVKFI